MLVFPIEQYIAQESNISYDFRRPRRIIAKDDDGEGESFALSTFEVIREWSTKLTFDVYSRDNSLVGKPQSANRLSKKLT